MLHNWRTRRRLQRRIDEDWAKVNALRDKGSEDKQSTTDQGLTTFPEHSRELHRQLIRHIRDLSMYNSALLLEEAERLVIDVRSSIPKSSSRKLTTCATKKRRAQAR